MLRKERSIRNQQQEVPAKKHLQREDRKRKHFFKKCGKNRNITKTLYPKWGIVIRQHHISDIHRKLINTKTLNLNFM